MPLDQANQRLSTTYTYYLPSIDTLQTLANVSSWLSQVYYTRPDGHVPTSILHTHDTCSLARTRQEGMIESLTNMLSGHFLGEMPVDYQALKEGLRNSLTSMAQGLETQVYTLLYAKARYTIHFSSTKTNLQVYPPIDCLVVDIHLHRRVSSADDECLHPYFSIAIVIESEEIRFAVLRKTQVEKTMQHFYQLLAPLNLPLHRHSLEEFKVCYCMDDGDGLSLEEFVIRHCIGGQTTPNDPFWADLGGLSSVTI
jgi:hypothetical protein